MSLACYCAKLFIHFFLCLALSNKKVGEVEHFCSILSLLPEGFGKVLALGIQFCCYGLGQNLLQVASLLK